MIRAEEGESKTNRTSNSHIGRIRNRQGSPSKHTDFFCYLALYGCVKYMERKYFGCVHGRAYLADYLFAPNYFIAKGSDMYMHILGS